jgi:hypothetical protein
MKLKWLNSPTRWKDSFTVALAILAGVETLLAISEISLKDNLGINCWITRGGVLLVVFLSITVATFIVKYYRTAKGISLKVRDGINVNIKQGDIFEANGWKVIAFNEYFDTTVDDKIIAQNSLNGKFIDNYVSDVTVLQNTIVNEPDTYTNYKRTQSNNRDIFPLGRIIPYNNEYMLLAFSHFENNEAHLNQRDYEHCLRIMWNEISRTYANKPIFIPLLGSGITRFDIHKSNADLLKCMLCTLRTSNADIKQPITILLREEAIQDINIYEMKGVK